MTTGKLAVVRIVRSVRRVRQTGCLGSRRVERSIPPRCIALSVRPKLFQRAPPSRCSPGTLSRSLLRYGGQATEYPANGSSVSRIHTHGQRSLMRTILRLRDKYGQAARLISTSQLNASLRFHIWPINLVVYQEPLGVLRLGRSHLVEGFTLRCLQRFSLPDVATRRCRWRDNRYTRGPSNPVLSY